MSIIIGFLTVIAVTVICAIIWPGPFGAWLFVVGTLFVLQIIGERFQVGMNLAGLWIRRIVRTGVAFFLFLVLRFLAGQWLGFYLIDSWNAMGKSGVGGFKGLLWGKAAPGFLIWELLFLLVASATVTSWVKGGRTGRIAVATVFGIGFTLTTLKAAIPMAMSVLTPTDSSIAEVVSGEIRITFDKSSLGGPAVTPEASWKGVGKIQVDGGSWGETPMVIRPDDNCYFTVRPDREASLIVYRADGSHARRSVSPAERDVQRVSTKHPKLVTAFRFVAGPTPVTWTLDLHCP